MRTAAVVLAAGASTRLGEPKQLVRIGGETLLDRAVRMAREAGCSPIVVVLGAEAERVRRACTLDDAMVVVNAEWREGMGASLRCGIAEIHDVDGCIVMTCDQPAATAEHLRVLMASGEVAASEYAGRRGVPAYFPRSAFAELKRLRGDAGARELLREARVVELEHGELDVDTPEDLARARESFQSGISHPNKVLINKDLSGV